MAVRLVEFSGGKVFHIHTDEAGYDVFWCKAHDCYYWSQSSGPGPYLEGCENDYWCDDETADGLRSGGEYPPEGTRLTDPGIPETAEQILRSGDDLTVCWCSVCADFYPMEHWNPACDHLAWCDRCSWWGGPGADTNCSSCNPEEADGEEEEDAGAGVPRRRPGPVGC